MGARLCPPLHTLPALYSPIIGARHHVLLIDELDAVNRAPTKKKTTKKTTNKPVIMITLYGFMKQIHAHTAQQCPQPPAGSQ